MNFSTFAILLLLLFSGICENVAGACLLNSYQLVNSIQPTIHAENKNLDLSVENSSVSVVSNNDSIIPVAVIAEEKNNSLFNYADTIIFDLSQSSWSNNSIEFPVYISSADSIHAMDFAFRFNHLKTDFDSLIVVYPDLQYLYHLNPADSTFRFTSNSINPINANSNLVMLRFEMIYGIICPGDIYDVEAYINGNVCSFQFNDCIVSNQSETLNLLNNVKVYPNPVVSLLYLEVPQDSRIRISDMHGQTLIHTVSNNQNEKLEIDLEHFASGIYLLSITENLTTINKKIIVY